MYVHINNIDKNDAKISQIHVKSPEVSQTEMCIRVSMEMRGFFFARVFSKQQTA